MKLLTVICIVASVVNSLPYQDPSVYDYFDFAEIPRIAPLDTSSAPKARSLDSVAFASERSDFGTFIPSPPANRRYDSPAIQSGRRIGGVGGANRRPVGGVGAPNRRPVGGVGAPNRRPVAPIQPIGSLAREVYSTPINQRRFTQNVYADYDSGSPSFNQPRFRPQQNYRPSTNYKPEFRPSQQYLPEQQYRPEYSRPQPQFRKQAQYFAEPQYRPNNQYRPKAQFKPDSQLVTNYVAQIEEPIYQESIDYQDLPITYEETPTIKTKKYVFDEKPSVKEDYSQYIDESLPYQNVEQPQYQDVEQPQYQDVEQPQYQDVEQPQYQDVEQPQYQDVEQPRYQDEYPQYDELPVYQDYVQEQPKQQEVPHQIVETNRDQSQVTVNALPVQDKEAQESVIEKRQIGVHGDLDAAGQAFAADAAAVENAKNAGRLSFQIHGQQGPHSYRFGYDTGKGYNRQFRYEERDGNGEVHGRYGFYDEHGKLKVVNYSAHPDHGFSADVPHDR